ILFLATPVVDGDSGAPAYSKPVGVKPVDDEGGGDTEITNSTKPTISGTEQVGKKLFTDGGTWKPSNVERSYQWLRDGDKIPGATKDSYKLTDSDEGLRCV